ncbi:RraA family protein [bacterium]|nr:MAG: RraA family protein [bacterium]
MKAQAPVDDALLARFDKLYTAVVSDVLDQLGLRHQVMAASIRPLYPEARLAAYAVTVKVAPVPGVPARREDYYKGELLAIDSLQPGQAMVVSSADSCFWGELLSTAARARGARGVVLDSFTRDAKRVIDMAFPTFCRGIHAQDSLGRADVAEINVPIVAGGVSVNFGDLLLGDYDGVVVVPASAAAEVIALAEKKALDENRVRPHLEQGMSAAEMFKRYGVL